MVETASAENPLVSSATGRLPARWRLWAWVVVVILGAIHVWHRRFEMNPDGVSYLDIADAYFRGDWANAINAYWSPLYSWMVGLALFLTRPTPYWEVTVVKSVNFGIYIAAWSATVFLVRALLHRLADANAQRWENSPTAIPVRVLFAAALSLFLFSVRNWIPLSLVGPDLCVYTVLCVAAALFLRISSGKERARTFALLGLVLGCGYLAKTVMFPIAVVILLAGWAFCIHQKKHILRMVLCSVVFLCLALPFLTAISSQKGRLTIGDTSWVQLTYFERIMAPKDPSGDPGNASLFPPRLRYPLGTPYFQEFASPVGGTYPKHYDPSYWWEGIKIRFNPVTHLKGVMTTTANYEEMFLQIDFILVVLIMIAAISHGFLKRTWKHSWPVLIIGCSGLGLYWLLHVQERYVAGFIMLMVLACFSSVRLPDTPFSLRLEKAAALAIFTAFAIGYGPRYLYEAAHSGFDLVAPSRCAAHAHTQWQVARRLQQLGLAPGDRVGTLFYGSDAYWARLAKLKIVADLSVDGEPPDFSVVQRFVPACFTPEGGLRDEVLAAFSKAGAKAIVARRVPPPERDRGWTRLANTDYYAWFLKE